MTSHEVVGQRPVQDATEVPRKASGAVGGDAQALKRKLAQYEDMLQRERLKVQSLEAEALYMRTAVSHYMPSKIHLHPTALAPSTPHKSHTTVVLDQDAETVTISRAAFELLQLKDRAMDSIKEGITIADCSLPDMPLIYANQGFVKITGRSVEEVLGRNCRFLQGEGTEEEVVQQLREAVNAGRPCQVTLTNYRKNGDAFVCFLSITPVHNAHGNLTHFVGVQSDITELVNQRKDALAARHQAVQAAAATEAKSQFLARMSHEIRTPLNGMIAVGQLLAEETLTSSQRDLVNTIRCSGETLLLLITDILDFSRIEANKMVLSLDNFKLRTVVEAAMEIAGLTAAQKRLQVAYHIADPVPDILLGDAQRLQQILLNVLNNAVKFTEKGQILLEIWMEERGTAPTSSGYPSEAVKILTNTETSLDGTLPASRVRWTSKRSSTPLPDDGDEKDARQPGTPTRRESRAGSVSDFAALGSGTEGGNLDTPSADFESLGSSTCMQSLNDLQTDTDSDLNAASEDDSASPKCRSRMTACGRPMLSPPDQESNPSLWNTIHFSVRDTGIGISQDDLGRLFQSFSQVDSSRTRQHGGSGLGLAICKRLVEAMGGKMWAESAGRDKGSTFRFYIHCPKGASFPMSPTRAGGINQVDSRAASSSTASADTLDGANVVTNGTKPTSLSALRQVLSNILPGGSEGDSLARPAESDGDEGANVSAREEAPSESESNAASNVASCSDAVTNTRRVSRQQCELEGIKVLLVEPCDMVRNCLLLYLRQQGMLVCAVKTEEQAIAQLSLQGAITRKPSAADFYDSADDEFSRSLSLEHPPGAASIDSSVAGPYDVVVTDILFSRVLHALIQASPSEAQRVVFIGWPGQHDIDQLRMPPGGNLVDPANIFSSAIPSKGSPPEQMPKALKEEMRHKTSARQLGYLTLFRPVRQERLKLAIKEVLTTSLEVSELSRLASSFVSTDVLDPVNKQHRLLSPMGTRSSSSSSIHSAATGSTSLARPLRLLLAEDNVINMKVAMGILQRIGFTDIVCAADGAAALQEIQARGGGDAFDIVLTDLHMPRKGGFELVKDIQENWPDTAMKVVAVTADAFDDTRDKCLEAGFQGWLAKPFRIQDLARVIDMVLSPHKVPAC